MKISTKGTYALEVVVDLGLNSSEKKPESIRNVAERRRLSEKYLERIIGLLRKAGVVTSIRGAYGGYFLSDTPENIKVSQILEAVEGNLVPVACLTSQTECKSDCEVCVTKEIWEGIWEEIKKVTETVTVADIIKNIKK